MKTARRIVQVLFLLFFVYLFFAASYPLTTPIPVDLFLRTDPLVALTTMLSARSIVGPLLWSVALALVAVAMGRVFCGWACPLGTLLDAVSFLFRLKPGRSLAKARRLKFYLLTVVAASSLLALQLTWTLDPIALLTRTVTLGLFPVATLASTGIFDGLFGAEILQDWLLRLQMALNSTLLPEQPLFFRWSGLVLLVFIAIVGLEFVSRRFWCRYLCPLGALYALLAKVQLFRRRVSDACRDCALCAPACKMNAIKEDPKETLHGECVLCYSCVKICPRLATSIDFRSKPAPQRFDLSRRTLLASSAAGLASALMVKSGFTEASGLGSLVRPPGSLEEPQFLERCIRCHECVRICSTSGKFLQPSSLEGGLEGFWTPVGVARTGYCEYNCNLCTKTCPTGAIHLLDLETKKRTRIGLAYVDRSRCIPWYRDEDCLVCQEHCPTPRKAIILKAEEVKGGDGGKKIVRRPYVDESLCIGCGICETRCPLAGRSAIIITPQNEERCAT